MRFLFVLITLLGSYSFKTFSQCSNISETVFGNAEWIVHSYSGNNFNTYQGYYIEPNLSFDTRLRWGTNNSPSDASGYFGCTVGVNQHSVSHKRTNFVCGTYQIDVQGIVNAAGHDDYALLYIDGVLVWSIQGWGQSHTNVWTGFLGPTSTIDFRHREFGGGSYGALNITQINTGAGINASSIEDCVLGETTLIAGSGTNFSWSPSTGLSSTTGSSVIATPSVTTTYTVTGVSACDGSTQSTTVTVNPLGGSIPTGFGNGEWNVLCYDGNNFNNLYGFYSEPNLSFDTRQRWNQNGTPSDASGYSGCDIPVDQHSVTYKRTNFTCGDYQIDVRGIINANGHDDHAFLYVDGLLVWSLAGCCQSHTNVWTGFLGPASTVEFRYKEFSGQSYGALNFTQLNSNASFSLTPSFDCNTGETTIVASGGSGITWLPSTFLNTNSGNIVIASPTAPTTYTATGVSVCSGNPVSQSITIQPSYTSVDPNSFGNGEWLAFCYNGNNFNTYSGYYTDAALSFDSRTKWGQIASPADASGYLGCDIPNDQHSVIYKRQGFACDNYQIDVRGIINNNGHDDHAFLYVDGVLVWSLAGCCQSHTNVWSGVLNANSTVEFRWREFGGQSYGALQIIPSSTNSTTWTGSNSNSWTNANNWSNGLPGASSSVVIPSGLINYPSVSSNVECLDLTINNGASLNFSAQADITLNGSLYVNNGEINTNLQANFIFNGGCTSSTTINTNAELELHNLTLNNSNGTIFNGGKVYISGHIYPNQGVINSNDNIILMSDAMNTAGIMEIQPGADFIGTIETRRLIDAGSTNWRFLTMPVQNADLEQFDDDFITSGFTGTDYPNWPSAASPWSSFYFYDEDLGTFYNDGFYVPNSTSDIVETGQGVWIWCGDTITGTQDFLIDAFGDINKGDVNYNVTFDNATGDPDQDGWNMVANPYPCAIDWDNPTWDKTNIDDAVYIWNPDNEQFASYVGGVGINQGSNLIAQFQGFFVRSNNNNPQLVVKESCKTNRNAAFIKKATNPDLIRLEIGYGQQQTAETVLRHTVGATDSVDADYDAIHFKYSTVDVPEIYTLLNEVEYGINSLESSSQTKEIPLVITSNFDGVMEVKATDLSGATGCLILEDTYTGISVDLMQDTSYSFYSYDTTTAPRFILKLSDEVAYQVSDLSCFDSQDGAIQINANNANLTSLTNPNFTQTGGNWQNLESDTYIVSGQNVCLSYIDTISINQPADLELNVISTIDASCISCCDGEITTTVSGGTGSYSVLVNGIISSVPVDSLCVGSNQILVYDGNGCADSLTVNVFSNTALTVNEIETDYTIYPTLTEGKIFISKPSDIKLVDIKGKTLIQKDNVTELDISAFSNGIYFLISNEEKRTKIVLKK